MRTKLVVVEGAEYASALSAYLEKFHKFKRIPYDGETLLGDHLDATVWQMGSEKVVLERCHLTAIQNGKCTMRQFRHIDATFKQLGGQLILAVGEKDGAGILADGYAASIMPKRVCSEQQGATSLLKWLGIFVPGIKGNGAAIRQPTQA
jgi:hypothetical protein